MPSSTGVLISVIANITINIGLNTQKYAHTQYQRTVGQSSVMAVSPVWWLGIGLQLFGELGNMVAYMFVAASVVAPLGAVGLVTNCFIATVILKEKMYTQDVIGAGMGGAGAALVAVHAPDSAVAMGSREIVQNLLLEPVAVGYLAMVGVIGTILWLFAVRHGIRQLTPPLTISACNATFTVTSIKCITLSIQYMSQTGTDSDLRYPLIYGCVATLAISGPLQIVWLNKTLARFPATSVVPSYYVMFTLAAVLSGVVVFRDFDAMEASDGVGFVSGLVLCILGVICINADKRQRPNPGEQRRSTSKNPAWDEASPLLGTGDTAVGASESTTSISVSISPVGQVNILSLFGAPLVVDAWSELDDDDPATKLRRVSEKLNQIELGPVASEPILFVNSANRPIVSDRPSPPPGASSGFGPEEALEHPSRSQSLSQFGELSRTSSRVSGAQLRSVSPNQSRPVSPEPIVETHAGTAQVGSISLSTDRAGDTQPKLASAATVSQSTTQTIDNQ